MPPTGPVLISLDGSQGSDQAIREASAPLHGHRALVVVVWKAGLAFELMTIPTVSAGSHRRPSSSETRWKPSSTSSRRLSPKAGRSYERRIAL